MTFSVSVSVSISVSVSVYSSSTWMAVVPAKMKRSPHERPSPYFSLIGHSSWRALSRLALSSLRTNQTAEWSRGEQHMTTVCQSTTQSIAIAIIHWFLINSSVGSSCAVQSSPVEGVDTDMQNKTEGGGGKSKPDRAISITACTHQDSSGSNRCRPPVQPPRPSDCLITGHAFY